MSYLSRLVRQSGLAAGHAPRRAPVAPLAAEPLSLEVEEVREAPPPAVPASESFSASAPVSAPASSVIHTAPPPPAPAPPVAPAEPAARHASALHAPEAASVERGIRVVEEIVRTETVSSASQPAAVRPPPAAPAEPVRRAEPPGLVEIDVLRDAAADRRPAEVPAVTEIVERLVERAAESHTHAPAPLRPLAPGEDRERAFAERLAEVRAWVAATPAPGERAEPAAPALEEVVRTAVPAPRAEVETPWRAGPPAPRPGIDLSALAAGAPAETNHFTLSIGSIQLTVEEPPRPARAPAPPAAVPAAGASPLPAASRLGAHYLRV